MLNIAVLSSTWELEVTEMYIWVKNANFLSFMMPTQIVPPFLSTKAHLGNDVVGLEFH